VLFRDALEASGKVAVAKVALRQREALAALRVREGVITLETLLWPDEVRKPDFAFLDEDIEVRSQELKMAASLIDTMTEDFEPDEYHDAYREALEAVVQAKIEGNDVVRPDGLDLPEAKKQPADLTEILRASVAAAKGGGRGKSDEDTRTPRTPSPAPSPRAAARPARDRIRADTRPLAGPETPRCRGGGLIGILLGIPGGFRRLTQAQAGERDYPARSVLKTISGAAQCRCRRWSSQPPS
jgi:DNA end-binding protein Ku